jgi:hypothetical protein
MKLSCFFSFQVFPAQMNGSELLIKWHGIARRARNRKHTLITCAPVCFPYEMGALSCGLEAFALVELLLAKHNNSITVPCEPKRNYCAMQFTLDTYLAGCVP